MWEKYNHIIPHIEVDSGVIQNVPTWVVANGYNTILVISDPNTYAIAGKFVIDSLRKSDINVIECRFTDNEPVPNEESIGIVTAAYSHEIQLILGVGSGTINDICTYVGEKVGKPSAIVGTAASMDGYASLGSAMLLGGIKITPPTQCPVAIFCDTDIMNDAPDFLTAAGLGDMLGKITALADWRLAHILVGEPMPPDIVSIVDEALEKIIAGVSLIAKRDPSVIKSITEGLILSGIAMSLYKDSRPASGTEHHLAHFWEMRMHALGKVPALHGLKVGLGAVIGLVMWKELANVSLDDINNWEALCKGTSANMDGVNSKCALNFEYELNSGCKTESEYEPKPDCDLSSKCEPTSRYDLKSKYERNIKRLYGKSAETLLKTENPNLPLEHIRTNWQKILDVAKSLPSPEEVAEMLSIANAPTRPADISLSADILHDSIIYARDRKKNYTLLQLLGDLGLLEDYADRVAQYFANTALKGVKCFVMDMDGTIYLGDNLFPFSKSFFEHLKKVGKEHVFYTNNSSQNVSHYIKKLERMDIPITPDKLLMSTHVLLAYLRGKDGTLGSRVFIAGTDALKQDFIDAGFTVTDKNPDFVVLGFDINMDYDRLTRFCDFVRSGLPYFGVNMDYNCPIDGGFIPDCGALAAAIETSTGVMPEFFGKPSRRTLDYIIEKTGYRESELCFVGDRLYTDIATTAGTKARSVLVLSGETKREDLQGSDFIPDIVVDNLTGLMDYL